MRLLRCTALAARIEIGIRLVQEVGITTQRVGAGKLPIRVRSMFLTCCCFVQKLLKLQPVVGLLLGWGGGSWGVSGGGGAGVRGWWVCAVLLVASANSQPCEKLRAKKRFRARCFSCERAFYNH